MATSQATVDFLLDQLTSLPNVRTRKMFGEYALYLHDKVVGFVCDDRLFIKPTEASEAFSKRCTAAPAYPGSKDYWEVPGDLWEDREWLANALLKTAEAAPAPRPKKRR